MTKCLLKLVGNKLYYMYRLIYERGGSFTPVHCIPALQAICSSRVVNAVSCMFFLDYEYHSVPVGHKQAKKLSELLVWFFYLDSLSNSLTSRILNYIDRFSRHVAKSKNLWGQVVMGGDNVPPPGQDRVN